jgi:hypothetical protein
VKYYLFVCCGRTCAGKQYFQPNNIHSPKRPVVLSCWLCLRKVAIISYHDLSSPSPHALVDCDWPWVFEFWVCVLGVWEGSLLSWLQVHTRVCCKIGPELSPLDKRNWKLDVLCEMRWSTFFFLLVIVVVMTGNISWHRFSSCMQSAR